jgi:hypothetical protein
VDDSLRFVRFEIEALGKRFGAMIMQHAHEFDAAVEAEFKKLAESGRLQAIIREQVEHGIRGMVQGAMDNWQVRHELGKKIAEMMASLPAPKAKERRR